MREVQFLRKMLAFTWFWARSRGVTEWETGDTGKVETWHMGYRQLWHLRPRYMGHLTRLPCDCRRRFRKIVWYSSNCVLEGGPHAPSRRRENADGR